MNLYQNKKGVVTVFVAVSLVMLLLFSAVVIDIGMLAVNKSNLQNACDAAVLAGARDLPYDTAAAENAASQYMSSNGAAADASEGFSFTIDFSDSNSKITVTASNKPVQFFFAPVIGINKGTVSAKAAAINAPIKKMGSGLRPFGVVIASFTYGQQIVLKDGAPNGYKGNFGAVDLDGTGAKIFEDTIKKGSSTSHYIGEKIDTETGNMVGPTFDGVGYLIDECTKNDTPACTFEKHKADCPRIITIPLIDTLDVNGKKEVTILGFASFYVESIVTVGNGNGHSEVTGRFIENTSVGEVDPTQTDTGVSARGVKLTE